MIEQAANIARSTIVQEAWRRGRNLTVHATVYSLRDGILRDLGYHVASTGELHHAYAAAIHERPSLAS